jgi:hypothetical protein
MAAREPAHPIEKRDVLHANPPNVARVKAIAEKLVHEGRWAETIDYLEIVPDQAVLARVRAHAVEAGAAWLLQQVERITGTKAEASEWLALSDSAARAERWRDAVRALAFSGNTDGAEALRASKCPEYDPFKPLGK